MVNKKNLKIMTILGTRPEIIRLSCILPKMDEYFNHIIVYTSQSYSPELSAIFFKDFNLRKPDYELNVKSDTLGGLIGNILKQSEDVMVKERPDALLILGDTNSSLSAIIAKRMKIPIFHMEAGNRSFDDNVPEEINRKITDHISDYNLAYTENSRRYLVEEGIHPGSIYVTGSPLTEVFEKFRDKIENSDILEKLNLEKDKFFVVSTHREENVDNPSNIKELFESLNHLTKLYKHPIIVSFHPRTRNRLSKLKLKLSPLIKLETPFDFFDYNNLQMNALCVLSDSGSVPEESAIFKFRAVQIRISSERPEAFDSGTIILTGFNKNTIVNSVELVVNQKISDEGLEIPEGYKSKNVSIKVVKLIMGLASIRKYHKT